MRRMIRVLSVVVLLFGLGAGLPSPSTASSAFHGYYRNSLGHRVPRPYRDPRSTAPPPRATALCANGNFSFSEHPYAPGTCSRNGGVQSYIGSADVANQTQRQGGVPHNDLGGISLCPPPTLMTERHWSHVSAPRR